MTSKSFLSNIWVVSFGAALCCFLWGSATPSIKTGYILFNIAASDTATVILFAGVRFLFAGIFTAIFGSVLQRKILVPQSAGAWGKIVLLGLVQTVAQYFFFYGGLTKARGVTSSIVLATNVFASLLVAAVFFKYEKLTLFKVTGCVIGFGGVVLLTVFGKTVDYSMSWNGEGFIVMSTLCYGISSNMVKRYSKTENTVMLSGWQFIFGGFVMIAVGACFGGHFSGFTPLSTILLVYLVFISAVAYTLWGLLLKYNDVSRVVVFGFLNPVFGVILSSIFLGERSQTGAVTLVSLMLVCIGILIVNKKNKITAGEKSEINKGGEE